MHLIPAGVHYSDAFAAWPLVLFGVFAVFLQGGARALLNTRLLEGLLLDKSAMLFPLLHPKLAPSCGLGHTFGSPFFGLRLQCALSSCDELNQ